MSDQVRVDAYRRDGVICCRGFFNAAQVAELRQALEAYEARGVRDLPVGDYTLEPDGKSVRNLWRMEEHDPFFKSLAERPGLLETVGQFIGGEPVVMAVESFNKPARVGSPVPPHQDNAYFCQLPADVLTAWIALDPATEENGAVEYYLGSHQELLPHVASGVKGNSMGLADANVAESYPQWLATVEPGDMLLHHCQTIHSSQPNRSPHSRLSLVIVYRAAHTYTDPQLQAAYRAALAAQA